MSFSGKPTNLVEQAIENDGFWPDLSVAEFQKGYRLPAEFLVELLADGLACAMAEVNIDLTRAKDVLQKAGISVLENAADTLTVAGWGYANKVSQYKRAVYCRAKANLLPQFATVNRRAEAANIAKESPETREQFLAFSQQAVRSIQGRGRITAALL